MTSEEIVLDQVRLGVFEIDAEGRIWRVMQRHGRVGYPPLVVPCRRHRAESRTLHGYLQVHIMVARVLYVASAHRVVYRALVGPIPDGLTINHKNGLKADNHPGNLELATRSEQALHARHVLRRDLNLRGERHPNHTLSDAQVADIRRRRLGGEELAPIAADFGIAFQTVSKIARGERRSAQPRSV